MKRSIAVVFFFTCLVGIRSHGEDSSSPEAVEESVLPICIPGRQPHLSYPLPPGSKNPNSVALSSDGQYLATANVNTNDVSLFIVSPDGKLNSGTRYVLPAGATHPIQALFSPNGLYLAVICVPNKIVLYKVGNGGALNMFPPHIYTLPENDTGILAIAFSPNSFYLAATFYYGATGNSGVLIYMVDDGTLIEPADSYGILPTSKHPFMVVFSPNGSYLAMSNHWSDDVTIFTVSVGGVLSNPQTYALPPGSTGPRSIAFSPQGEYLVTANDTSNDVTLFKVTNGVLSNPISTTLPNSQRPVSIAFAPNGLYVATANFDTNDRALFKVENGGVLNYLRQINLPLGSLGPVFLAFAPSGHYLATANYQTRDVSILREPRCEPWGQANIAMIRDNLDTIIQAELH